jgi:hypothetical protein
VKLCVFLKNGDTQFLPSSGNSESMLLKLHNSIFLDYAESIQKFYQSRFRIVLPTLLLDFPQTLACLIADLKTFRTVDASTIIPYRLISS